jgi:ribosome-associated heat shock protein Hsp15
MRADSFFWSIRLHKTRSLATVAIKSGRVSISDIVIKPSRVLKIGETFKIRHKGYHTTHEVINFPKSRVKMALVENFMKTTTPNEEIEKKKLLDLALKANNNTRLGRPTKRHRRDFDGCY